MKTTHPLEVTFHDLPLQSAADVSNWVLSLKSRIGHRILENLDSSTDHLDRCLEIAQLGPLPGAYLCCSFYQQDMNDVFTRMGIFMGAAKGVPERTLCPHEDPTLINYKKLVAGHNLPGPVVLDFHRAAQTPSHPSLALNPQEQAFFKQFLSKDEVHSRGDRFYLIGISIQNTKSYSSVITHEVRHALLFLDPAYCAAVRNYWKTQVTIDDRARITQALGKAYSVDQEPLIPDEFQAYLLQDQAETDRLKEFVPQHRIALQQALASAGIQPLFVDE